MMRMKMLSAKRGNFIMVFAILVLSLYCYIISMPSSLNSGRSTKNTSAKRSSSMSSRYNNRTSLKPTENNKQCSIYVAPSSLKGNPGYGIYTTRDLWKGEKILGGPDGVAIPVEAYGQRDIPKGQLKSQWIRLWDPYWWGRGVPDHVSYEAGPDVVDFQIGFGYLPNHHCELSSLDPGYPETAPYEDSLANRYESPGAGAFSYNKGREFSSTRDVRSGEELFMSYGYCRHGQGPGWTKNVYMPAEFNAASDIIWSRIGPNPRESFEYDDSGNVVWDESVIGKDTATVKAKLVKELLPETKEQVQALAAAPLTRKDLPAYLAQKRGVNPRTPEWIRENGMCLETIVPKESTLPDAGQGGFAQFPIKKGDVIAIAPLLHIMDRDVLAIYESEKDNSDDGDDESNDEDEEETDGEESSGHPQQVGTQLLLNYCFSNPHSTILLCPTTNAVLINHCSKRTKKCGPDGPNADYRWSSGWDPTSDEWRQQSIEDLRAKQYRGLSFEIFALRDIRPGEEVFIDYGEEWEQAWARHVQEWKPPPVTTSKWISAKDANENGGPILKDLILGKENIAGSVDHPYLMTGCVYWPTELDEDDTFKTPNPKWRTKMTATEILETYSDDGSSYKYRNDKGYAGHNDGLHWPCTVVGPQNLRGDSYVVRIHPGPTVDTDELPWAQNDLPRLLSRYPRESIHYFVKPYASDQHLPGVFRQPIGLRDDILPKQWRNLER